MNTQAFGDKEVLSDFITSEKMMSSAYNTYAGECVCESLRNDFLSNLRDGHGIQAELFNEANNRGWYTVKQAPAAEVNQVKTKYTSGS